MAVQEETALAFVLYRGLTLLDLVGPLQVFAGLRRFNGQSRAGLRGEQAR